MSIQTTSPAVAESAIGAQTAARVAGALRAVADPLRLRMVSLLVASPTGSATVQELASLADVSQPTVSHHLKVLKEVGLLTSARHGTWVHYRVVPRLRRPLTTLLDAFAAPAVDEAAGASTSDGRPVPLPGLEHADDALRRVARDLADEHPTLPADLVLRTVRESYTALVRSATVSAHLLVTAARFARQRLDDIAHVADPDEDDRRPRVLFVCTANAGRSQLAAALLSRLVGDAAVVRSAGTAPAPAVHAVVRPLLAELGADDTAFPKPLTDDALRASDVVVTMGCGDACPVLPGTRYEDWAVGDPALASPAGARAVRDDLERRVRALATDLLPDLRLP